MKINISNPIRPEQYADPEARYYQGKYYIYVTHSLPYQEQVNQSVLVSKDMANWDVCENILDMSGFPWVKGCVWAPTVEEKNGKYYYIFASNDIPHMSGVGGLEIAVSDSPTGPFHAYLKKPLVDTFYNDAQPIDAHLFKDEDGTMYLLYGGWGHCNIAVMNEDMTGFVPFEDGEVFREITPEGYVEGPCMFKKDGQYYFMWSGGDWGDGSYHVRSAVSAHPWGPFTPARTVLSGENCDFANGPGHNGFFFLPKVNSYLVVYHRHIPENKDCNARYICIDVMDFDENGEIAPITMTKALSLEIGD